MSAPHRDRDIAAQAAWSDLSAVFFDPELRDRLPFAAETIGLPHPGALRALLIMDPDEPSPMRTLAGKLRSDASYATALVDDLEAAGYVTRSPSPTDRRVKLLTLTTAGRTARTKAQQILHAPPSSMDALTDTEVATFARLAAKLAAARGTATPNRSRGGLERGVKPL